MRDEAAVAAVASAALYGYVASPLSISGVSTVSATVTFATLHADAEVGKYYVSLQAKRDDGVLIRATGAARTPPKPGQRISLVAVHRWFWVNTYVWAGEAE